MQVTEQRDRLLRLRKSLNCDGWRAVGLLGLCIVLLLIQMSGAAGEALLRYDRGALGTGQYWRLVTAHVVHLGVEHALLNIAGLVVMWILFAADYPARIWWLILAGAVAAIDTGLWFLSSTTQWYVGSSGVLHGVLAAGTLAHLRRGEADGWLLAAFLVGKLVYEQSVGPLPLTSGGSVIVDAHLYGAAGGAAVALLLRHTVKPV